MRRLLVSALGVVFALSALPARGDFPDGVPDKYQFALGGMFTDSTTQGAIGSEEFPIGTFLDLEDVFNLPIRKSVFTGSFCWNIARDHNLDVGYVVVNRESARVLEQDVEFGKYIFGTGSQVNFKWDSGFTYVAYRHDFLKEEKVKIGGSAGISYLRLGTGISGSGTITTPDDPVPIEGGVSQDASVKFPVPLIGLQVDWAFAKRWVFQLYFRALRINVSDFKGSHNLAGMHVDWFPTKTKHFGVGAGYDIIKLDVKKFQSGELQGQFLYNIEGLTLYLKGTF